MHDPTAAIKPKWFANELDWVWKRSPVSPLVLNRDWEAPARRDN
jgi:hypothetical protein